MTKRHSTTDRQRPKQAAILSAAADLFVQHGYDGTSTEMIAEAAGVSRQTIYNQFENKEALFLAIASELVSEIIGPLGDALERGADLRETLIGLARRGQTLCLSPKVVALRRLVITEVPRFPQLGRAIYDAGPARVEKELAAYLSEQARLGRLRIVSPLLAAQQFMALAVHPNEVKAELGIEINASEDEIAQHAENAAATFLRAFGAGE